jgi:hypothetical protein
MDLLALYPLRPEKIAWRDTTTGNMSSAIFPDRLIAW